MKVAKIVIEQTAYSFDKPYSYIVPNSMEAVAECGCRVIVPFGNGNNTRQGIIVELYDTDNVGSLKQISSVLDSKPILDNEMLLMAKWLHEQLFCTYFDAIKATLPAGVSFKITEVYLKGNAEFEENFSQLNEYFSINPITSKEALFEEFDFLDEKTLVYLQKSSQIIKKGTAVRKLNDTTAKFVRPNITINELSQYKLSPKQLEVLKYIINNEPASVKDVLYYTGVSVSVVNALKSKDLIDFFEKEVLKPYYNNESDTAEDEIVLTNEQQLVFNGLKELYSSDKLEEALLYGVTGSGKTSVFLKMVDEAVANNKGVIIMVPEISLTPQTISIFGKRYGEKIAVFHSAMSQTTRMNEWKRVKNGDAIIAIGTRSAIFAPVKNLSLIILDEEQEHSYKSEKAPRFHARDLAKFRAKYNNCLLLLASATPSIETYAFAKANKYKLFTLTKRYGNAVLPNVKIVDMKREVAQGNTGSLSKELLSEISLALVNSHQAIVLLNRRGYNTYVSCPSCGFVATCPNCSVTMTYHSANERLMCHYCGHSESANKVCPSCNNAKLRFVGMGTQKIEQELKIAFPEARVLRLDADSTSSRGSMSEYLEKFSDGEYDIMLGTQMVAKGLNFPNVTVVGVLGSDSAMNSVDYRSFERSFSLLTQVLGRAGRGDFIGTAVLQTNEPSSKLIELAAKQDYDAFFNDEIMSRKMLIYPPYCDLVAIYVQSETQNDGMSVANTVFNNIKTLIKDKYPNIKLIILGPSVSVVPKIKNRYRFMLLIKVKNNRDFRDMLRQAINVKTDKSTNIIVDINPETII